MTLISVTVLFEISRILNTGLDMETLSICVRLCEQGINPEALSSVIKELRKATEALKVIFFASKDYTSVCVRNIFNLCVLLFVNCTFIYYFFFDQGN